MMDPLEKRLNQLKNAYDELPTTDKTDKIMNRIRDTEVKKKKKSWMTTQLPYVASFMGVLLIGSILVIQLLSHQDSQTGDGSVSEGENTTQETETNETITAEQIAEKHQELLSFYNEQKLALEQMSVIDIALPEELNHISEAKALVDQVASRNYKEYKNEAELEKSFSEYTEFVRDKFEMPKTDLEQLDENTDLFLIISKQTALLSFFQDKAHSLPLHQVSQDFFEGLEQLNNLQVQDPEILEFATAVVENGYWFIDSGEGGYDLAINYNKFENMDLKENEKQFVSLMTKRMAMDAELQIDWNELADRIVLLEELKNSYSGTSSVIGDTYTIELYWYLKGTDNSRAFINGTLAPELKASYERFLETYSNTETYATINEYYNLLKEFNFTEQEYKDFNY
ncbi:hypothetical protein [Bacillus sp. AK128]